MRLQATKKSTYLLICVLLAGITLAVFAQIRHHDIINYDDPEYAFDNWHVYNGVTLDNLKFAFTEKWSANWHPLTWISHMLDFQLFGVRPGLHHLSSLFLHVLSTLLLFLALSRMTCHVWRSAFVAALFALHPFHVESVAWISERKDVLSGFFFMLILLAYTRYVEKSRRRSPGRASLAAYAGTLFWFVCGLMSKPMLVTVPVLLLILDFWPFGRYTRKNLKEIIVEKIPFFALSAISSVITIFAQTGAFVPVESLPFTTRFLNAILSYWGYLEKTFWPVNLSIFYPHPGGGLFSFRAAGAFLALCLIFILTFRTLRKRPYLAAGWLWFFVMLLPVIGIIQVGIQAMAGRYMYLSLIGIFIMAVWLISDWMKNWKHSRWFLGTAGVLVILSCTHLSWKEAGYWKNSETVFRRALQTTKNNYYAHFCLGLALNRAGNLEEAQVQYAAALAIKPDFLMALNAMGLLMGRQGNVAEAEKYLARAVNVNPGYYEAQHNLAAVLARKKQNREAIAHLEEVVKLRPGYPPAWYRLGNLMVEENRFEEAIQDYQKAVELRQDFSMAHYNLAKTYARTGKVDDANRHYMLAIHAVPHSPEAHFELGMILAEQDDFSGAASHFEEALKTYPNFADAHHEIGKILAKEGRKEQALGHFQTALRIRPTDADIQTSFRNLQTEQPLPGRESSVTTETAADYYEKGKQQDAGRQLIPAIASFKKALELDPSMTDAHYRLGVLYAVQGDLTNAFEQFLVVLKDNPRHADAEINLGNILAVRKDYEGAISHYERALELAPANSRAHFNLGAILEKNAKKDEAREHYREALRINPDYSQARLAMEKLEGSDQK